MAPVSTVPPEEPPGHWRMPDSRDEATLRDAPQPAWLELLVRLLDDGFRVPGTDVRFGIDPIVGLLAPGAGDAIGGLTTAIFLLEGLRRGVPPSVLLQMALNGLIDSLLGTVPLLGDLFDLAWKANRRNLELLERHGLQKQPATWRQRLLATGLVLLVLAAAMLPLLLTATLVHHLLLDR